MEIPVFIATYQLLVGVESGGWLIPAIRQAFFAKVALLAICLQKSRFLDRIRFKSGFSPKKPAESQVFPQIQRGTMEIPAFLQTSV
ncbi:hypothetical protein [Paenibacillus ferrarius]|uniref:hypothetical protein n=1 Tax=Paenibacillus ferrarius TaxID=1469647 RepID=UPI003D2CEA22